MSRPIVLTTHSARKNIDSEYDSQYREAEEHSAENAGFKVVHLPTGVFGPESKSDIDLAGRDVVLRHFAGEEAWLPSYVSERGGNLLVPSSASAADWYETTTFSPTWFANRSIGSFSLRPYNYLDEDHEMRSLRQDLQRFYDDEAVDSNLFVKSTTKGNMSPAVYTIDELLHKVTYWIALACHNRPTELIWSQPIEIQPNRSKYKKNEYRCFVVDGSVVSCSIFTDNAKKRNYRDVVEFANGFAAFFKTYLPRAYCLDVARLIDQTLTVVELNDFQGSGLFADHDMTAVFEALK